MVQVEEAEVQGSSARSQPPRDGRILRTSRALLERNEQHQMTLQQQKSLVHKALKQLTFF